MSDYQDWRVNQDENWRPKVMINEVNQEIDRRKLEFLLSPVILNETPILTHSACHRADMLEEDNSQLICSVCRRACEGVEG